MNFRYLIVILVVLFLAEALLVVPEVWGPGKRFMAAVLPALVVDYTNVDRTNDKKAPLQINPLLTKAAQLKAEDMASRSYFSHEGPEGEAPWDWFDKVGYKYVYAGENLALDFFESSEVNKAWMNSPKHRENILGEKFTDIGIGLANGQFEGKDSVFIVQFFGSTEESLARRDKAPIKLGFRRANVLSAAIGLSDGILTKMRYVSLKTLQLFGYKTTNGKII
jgi:hypothetical protein